MFRNKLILSAALAAACLVASQSTFAAPVAAVHGTGMGHMFLGSKMVKLSIANSGTEPLNLMLGTQAMTIQPGKTVDVQAAVGSSITVVNDTRSHKAGDVITQVTKDLSGATLRVS